MNFKVVPTEVFSKELKRLVKKHPALKGAVRELATALLKASSMGTPLGRNCHKIRLRSPDKTTGKSGGFRLITYVNSKSGVVFLLTIYDKSKVASISDSEIKRQLSDLLK